MTDRTLARLAGILTAASAGYLVLRTLEAIGRGAGCVWSRKLWCAIGPVERVMWESCRRGPAMNAERGPEPPDAWGRVAFWLLLIGGSILAAQITFSLLWRRPPEQPIERLLSPARRVQIEQCFETGDALALVVYKAQENQLRYSAHPYLFEGQRARLALRLVECGRKARMP